MADLPALPSDLTNAMMLANSDNTQVTIAKAEALRARLGALRELATVIFESGIAPKGLKNPAAIMVVMMYGASIDIPEMTALQELYVVGGKVGTSGKMMLALVYRSGLMEDFKSEVSEDGQSATCTVKRKGIATPYVGTFTLDDARRMTTSVWENGSSKTIPLAESQQYRTQLGVMLEWRAIAKVLRKALPDVLGGLYSLEELASSSVAVSADGEMTFIEDHDAQKIIKPAKAPPAAPKPKVADDPQAARAIAWAKKWVAAGITKQEFLTALTEWLNEYDDKQNLIPVNDLSEMDWENESAEANYDEAVQQWIERRNAAFAENSTAEINKETEAAF